MELKHIIREISQLETMEATNYISEHGLEKLKEFRYLKSLHQEKVKPLNVTWTTEELLNIIEDNEHLDDLRMFFTQHNV